tara:strand:+ start:92 stop:844 length:753 start_codon:yes stop_codon:yes gene_type:complete
MKTIGILGGMGPEATNQLATMITALTTVEKDQDHVPVITFNNSKIPHRINFIYGNSENPIPEMISTAKKLESAGADVIIMPCNTAHYFIKDIQSHINIPFMSLIEETVLFIKRNFPMVKKVGILGTNLTIREKLYENELNMQNLEAVLPNSKEEEFLMKAIYDLKAGKKENAKKILKTVGKTLVERGAEIIICGCTEIPLVLKQEDTSFIILDPAKIGAQAAILFAKESTEKTEINLVEETNIQEKVEAK